MKVSWLRTITKPMLEFLGFLAFERGAYLMGYDSHLVSASPALHLETPCFAETSPSPIYTNLISSTEPMSKSDSAGN